MKYLKLLFIPLLTFMFMVPTSADVIEIPYHANIDNPNYHYIIVRSFDNDSKTWKIDLFTRSSNVTNFKIRDLGDYNRLETGGVASISRLENGQWVTLNLGSQGYTFGGSSSYSNFEVLYSSSDVLNYSDNSVYAKKKYVGGLVPQIIKTEIPKMETQIMAAFGKISLAGGLILGAVFLMLLVARLLRWGTHSVR